ncbi:hypothetical protein FSP39_013606 [Pinctada imbricata]|uniref:Uncharacterized protein n=1 Tax=Pinctada imbricata TaxID=66713 RepID=A0AA88YDA9_PINIB|nr:hypothetical protein FSP39_013606 [Pinctada imbricata]
MLSRYLKLAGIDSSSTEFIFRQVTFLKKTNSYMLRKCDKPLSYTRAREIILSALVSASTDLSLVFTAYVQVEPPQQLLLALMTAFLRNTEGGGQKKLKMVMLRKAYKKNYLFQKILVSDKHFVNTFLFFHSKPFFIIDISERFVS